MAARLKTKRRTYMKKSFFNLTEKWYIAPDPDNKGKENGYIDSIPDGALDACVPSIIQQFLPNYHKVAFYWCRFTPEIDRTPTERIMLNFGGVDYMCEVWLNSVYLGATESPETPFSLDVTDAIRIGKENLLTVRVIPTSDEVIDGISMFYIPHRNKVPSRRAGSCLNHSGIWYEVSLSAIPEVYIEDKFYETNIDTGEVKLTVKVKNLSTGAALSTLTARISDCTQKCTSAEEGLTLNATPGSSEHTFSITVPTHKLWSTDEPNLYKITLELESYAGLSTCEATLGFREFEIKDGYFYLNRKRIFLKSSHSGNAFPIGQMLPVVKEQMRQDFIYAKAAGFNMLRAIAGQFRPEQIELANEIGLMIYEECLAGWCTGLSEQADALYTNEEEFREFVEKRGHGKVGTLSKMLERWDNSTERMILRDRSQPSVVIWGLLNETRSNAVFEHARDYLPRLRKLDPTRVVFLNSGRFDFDHTIGSASNPYSDEWEARFGPECKKENINDDPDRWAHTGDNHKYVSVPITKKEAEYYKTYGNDFPLGIFHSENGIGSLFNVIDEWRHFKQYGTRPDLEDGAWLEYQARAFEKDFYEFGLDKIFAFPELLLRESQRVCADDRARLFALIRSNPKFSGYSLTGLLDHGMCGEGLFSYFRKWKPNTFDAVADGFAKLRFSLFATENSYSDGEITLEAHLANEGILPSGTYHARFAIVSEDKIYHAFDKEFTINGDDFATLLFKESFSLGLPEGTYKLVAELDEGAAGGTEVEFFVTDKKSFTHTKKRITVFDASPEVTKFIKTIADVNEFSDSSSTDDLLVVGAICKEKLAKVLDFVKNGGKAILLDTIPMMAAESETAKVIESEIEGLTTEGAHEWLYHTEYVFANRGVFSHFGTDRLMRLARIGELFPKFSFKAKAKPCDVVCPGFLTGYYGVKDAYGIRLSLAGYPIGRGTLYLSGFRITDFIDQPNAGKILHGIINTL